MEKLGLVASGSKSSICYVIFEEEAELKHGISEEDFVVVEDERTKSQTLGIIRSGRGIDPTLKTGTYGVGTAYVSKGKGDLLTSNRRFFDAQINILGEIKNGKIFPNRKWITPGSWVHHPGKNPFSYYTPEGTSIDLGHYGKELTWKFNLDADEIIRHLGIFGSTGSGKSHLVRVELIPELVNKTKFSVLVFDYSGEDFVPHAKDAKWLVIPIKDVKMGWEDLAGKVVEECKNFGYYGGKDNPISSTVQGCTKRLIEEGAKNFYDELKDAVIEDIQRTNTGAYAQNYSNKFNIFYEDVDPKYVNGLVERKIGNEQIEELLKQNRVVVVDLSEELPESRVSVVTSMLRYYLNKLKRGKDETGLKKLNRVIVIDEAPQYCPSSRDYVTTESTRVILDLAAVGRKHNLGLVLLAQGIAGDVGINAGIRRNLNTKIVGKISPSDVGEASKEILRGKVDDDMITNLQRGEFYISGIMSPIDQAVLIKTFKDGGEKYGGT